MAFSLRTYHNWHYVGSLKTQVEKPQTLESEELEYGVDCRKFSKGFKRAAVKSKQIKCLL